MSKTREVRPFGARDKFGYLFGDLANDFSFIFASTYVMVFYTKVSIRMALMISKNVSTPPCAQRHSSLFSSSIPYYVSARTQNAKIFTPAATFALQAVTAPGNVLY